MRGDYDARIARAHHLAKKFPASAAILDFYCKLAALQKSIWSAPPVDTRALAVHFPALLDIVKSSGPQPLIQFAQEHLETQADRENILTTAWSADPPNRDYKERSAPESHFFSQVLLQPYAEHLSAKAQPLSTTSLSTCPVCNSKPVAAILRGEGDGAKRSLLCSLCSTEWPFRRVFCANCAEEQKDQLPIYTAAEIDHVRVEVCDTCRTYIKSVNLTKDGFAIPEVDELATVALDVWADDHGYAKLEPNLLGL